MKGLLFDIFAKDKTGQAFDAVKNRVKSLDDSFAKLKKAALIFGGGTAVFGWLKGASQAAEHINELSVRLGIGADVLSQYQLIAGETGVELDSIAKGMQQLAKNSIEAAEGGGAARDAFNKLGIDATKFKELSIDQQFAVVAEAMKGIQNPAERVNIAMALMGKSGAEMLQAMEMGGDGLVEMQRKADALGITLNNTETQAIDTMMDAFGNLGLQAMALGQHFIAQLAPAITLIADALQIVLAGAIVIVRDGFRQIGVWALNAIGHVANGFAWLTDKLSVLPGAAGEAFASMSQSLRDFGDVMVEVTADNDDFAASQKKANLELRDTSELLKKVQGALPATAKGYDSVAKATKRVTGQAKEDFDSLEKTIERTAQTAQDDFINSLFNAGKGFEGLRSTAENALRAITSSILNSALNQLFAPQPTLPWLQSSGGGFGSLLSIFDGFFADGGTIGQGKFGIVGEDGPELAYAGTSPLSIAPMQEKGGDGVQIIYSIDARGAAPGVETRIIAALQSLDRSIESRAVMAVANAKKRNPNLL